MNRPCPFALFGMVVAVMTLIFKNRQDASLRNLQGRANFYGKLEEIDKYVRDNYFGEISEQALTTIWPEATWPALRILMPCISPPTNTSGLCPATTVRWPTSASKLSVEARLYAGKGCYPDSPAESKGLKVGDFIVKVDDLSSRPTTSTRQPQPYKARAVPP